MNTNHLTKQQEGFKYIDPSTFEGRIPPKHDLVVFDLGDFENMIVLNGFDEVGMFEQNFSMPLYGFVPTGI